MAVLAVLVFHLERAWLPGGFVGVDVFFVISGYLITTILVNGMQAENFSFWQFYQRRIARLFPALLVMVAGTLLVAKLCFTSWDFSNTAASFSASLLSIANIHQWMQGDYFALSADAQPLMHCWSLSVEEQFYVVFPIILYGMKRASKNWRLGVLIGFFVASLGMSVYWSHGHSPSGFYLLPARAWELLAGSFLAALPVARADKRLGGLGLILIFGAFLMVREGPQFPGWIALVPVVGAGLIVRYGAGGILGWGPLVGVGQASYSLYLWHWPVFSFVDYALLFQSPLIRLLLKLVLSAGLAYASYRYVERPCRQKLNLPVFRRTAYGALLVCLVMLVPFGYALRKSHYIDGSDGEHGARVFEVPQALSTVMLIGDSQATMYAALLRDLARAKQSRLIVRCQAGKDPLVGGSLWKAIFAAILRERPNHLVLACHWNKLRGDRSRLVKTVNALKPYVAHIVVITMPPDLPKEATREAIRAGSRAPFHEPSDKRDFRHEMNRMAESVAGEGVSIIDTEPYFVREDGSVIVIEAGERLYHDSRHLSSVGAYRVREALDRLLVFMPK